MIEIETNIPILESANTVGRPRKYPFDELNVADSFVVPGKKRNHFAASIAAAERRTGFTFVTYNFPDGARVWRRT